MDDFFSRFLPSTRIKPKDREAIHARVLRTSYKRGRWRAFPLDPEANKTSDGEAFEGLVRIADAVRGAALHCVPQPRAQTTFDNILESSTSTSRRSDKMRLDGCFVCADAMSVDLKHPHPIDIAATGHFKKSGTSLKQLTDVSGGKILSGSRLMRDRRGAGYSSSTLEHPPHHA